MTEKSPMPPPQSEFDAYSQSYDKVVNGSIAFSGLKVDFFTRAKAGYLSDLVAAQFPGRSDLEILDVGCGIGNYHPYIKHLAKRLDGIDVSSKCIELARSRNPEQNYSLYDGLVLPYGDSSFDVVFAICVVHHVPPVSWANFASELHRVLRPSGIVVIFEHNPLNPLTQKVVSNCEFDADAVLLKSGETERLLKDCGLADVASRYILTVPLPGASGRRVDRLFSRLPLGAQYFTRGTKPKQRSDSLPSSFVTGQNQR